MCLALAATTALLVIGGAFGSPEGNPPGFFALDKNATHNLNTPHVGIIKSSINSTATSMTVCEYSGTPATLPAGATLLIDAEQVSFVSYGTISSQTGGCSFSDPNITPTRTRVYNITRHANSTTAASHPGDSDVTQLTTTGALPGNDWDQVYAAVQANPPSDSNPNPCSSSTFQLTNGSAVACDWVSDPPGQTIFTGGSSDIADINTWTCTNQSVPDADEILHAYAIKYSTNATPSNQFLYFGADRFATNGSKDFGFWFFKNPISSSGDTITNSCPNGAFSGGNHTPGDILLLGTFTQGGAIGSIRTFKWVASGGDVSTHLLSEGTFGDCVPGASSDKGCNTINNTTINSPWAYQGKTGAANVIYSGGFMEGGIDLGALGLTGCFSSFMAETRSSPSLTAELKDFTIGKFEACGATVKTTPKAADGTTNLTADSNSNNLVETSIGSGTVQVKDSADFSVNGTDTFTGSLKFYICGPIDNPAACAVTINSNGTVTTSGVAAGSQTVTANGTYTSTAVTLTKAGRYCWASVFVSGTTGVPNATDNSIESGTPDTSSSKTGECFEVLPVQSSLDTQAVLNANGDTIPDGYQTPLGGAVFDTATLSGTATQPGTDGANATYPSINADPGSPAGGKITFELLKDDCSTDAVAYTGSTDTNPQDFTPISGDDTYGPVSFSPDAPGTYHWVATYTVASGDVNNIGSDHNTDCSDTNEDVTVQQLQPTMDTNQSFDPKDSATVDVAGGAGDLDGYVVFELFVNNSTCDGTADYSSGQIAVSATDTGAGNTLEDTVSWDSGHFFDTDGTTFNWVVSFHSNNTAHKDVTSNCTEDSSIAIDNGSQANTP
ncbi:MAG TPA: hypothetical protein VFU30_10770 [Gaiellaceae bacterium]|nr:hypothetical protein [Gaiellaceae bacterium]